MNFPLCNVQVRESTIETKWKNKSHIRCVKHCQRFRVYSLAFCRHANIEPQNEQEMVKNTLTHCRNFLCSQMFVHAQKFIFSKPTSTPLSAFFAEQLTCTQMCVRFCRRESVLHHAVHTVHSFRPRHKFATSRLCRNTFGPSCVAKKTKSEYDGWIVGSAVRFHVFNCVRHFDSTNCWLLQP